MPTLTLSSSMPPTRHWTAASGTMRISERLRLAFTAVSIVRVLCLCKVSVLALSFARPFSWMIPGCNYWFKSAELQCICGPCCLLGSSKKHVQIEAAAQEIAEGRWTPDPNVPWTLRRHPMCEDMEVFSCCTV